MRPFNTELLYNSIANIMLITIPPASPSRHLDSN